MSKPSFYIVDGNSFIYRAYHGLPPLTNRDGHPTGAISGVLSMLSNIFRRFSPDKLVVCFDHKGKNFRHEISPDYKSNRPPTPPDLAQQFQPLKDILTAWGLPIVCEAGVEADDTMGTLAIKAVEAGYEAVVCTSDKDMAQLLANDSIRILNTKETDKGTPFGREGVVERYKVQPEQIVDWLSLKGDAADGIQGVYKVGDDTAAKWLAQYGSLAALIDDADNIKGKRGEYLRDALSFLPMNQQLITLKTDVDFEFDCINITACRDEAALFALASEYGLEAFKRANGVVNPNADSIQTEVVFCETPSSVTILAKKLSQISAQTLIVSEVPEYPEYIAVSINNTEKSWVVALSDIAKVLRNRYEAHNFPKLIGAKLKGVVTKMIGTQALPQYPVLRCDDLSVLYNSVIGGSSKGATIEAMNAEFGNYELSPLRAEFKLSDKKAKWNKLSLMQIHQVVAEEKSLALSVINRLTPENRETLKGHGGYNQQLALMVVLATMQSIGMRVNTSLLSRFNEELNDRIDASEKTMLAKLPADSGINGLNVNSAAQVAHLLYDVMGIEPKSKKRSTAEKELMALAEEHSIVADILNHRKLLKLQSTSVVGLLNATGEDGVCRATLNQGAAGTGRLSVEDPNLQAVPVRSEEGRRVRAAFEPPEGYSVVTADYSQIELRILAHLTGSKMMIDAYKQDMDLHAVTASEVFGVSQNEVTEDMRRSAKAINFGLIYGISAKGLARDLGVSKKVAEGYLAQFFEGNPEIKPYQDGVIRFAKEHRHVQTATGRLIPTPNVVSSNPMQRMGAERAAINAPMQGTAADIVNEAMVRLAAPEAGILGDNAQMVMQVHDELVFYVKTEQVDVIASKIKAVMESAVSLRVPLKVSVAHGCNWAEAK